MLPRSSGPDNLGMFGARVFCFRISTHDIPVKYGCLNNSITPSSLVPIL